MRVMHQTTLREEPVIVTCLWERYVAYVMQVSDYIKAGKIAGEVREIVRKRDFTGKTVYEVCEWVEGQIRSRGVDCAFPVNTSINEVAAHYTAEPDDPIVIENGDLVKVDLGAHINGYIADTAVTLSYNEKHDALVQAAEDALARAMRICTIGAKSGKIGKVIERSIKSAGFKPIANLSGHSLDQYTIHAGKTIPNIWAFGGFSLSDQSAYACEPFCTYSDGGGFVRNGQTKNIFALHNRRNPKNAAANEMLSYIWENFSTLPFAERWLTERFGSSTSELLEILIKKKTIKAYSVLLESHGKTVAQAEHTFIPGETEPLITTKHQT